MSVDKISNNSNFLYLFVYSLQKLPLIKLFLLSVFFSVVATEIIVSAMGILLKGEITYDYLLTGFVASLCVAALICAVLVFFLNLQKLAEAELRTSEERFRMIAETMTDVFWMSDAKMEVIHYLSPAYEQVWQRSCEELYAKPRSFLEVVHPEDRDQLVRILNEKMLLNQVFEVEYRILRSDGTVRWILDKGFPVQEATGSPHRYVGVAKDITERKQVESEMLLATQTIWMQANFDPLTNLPNRRMFLDRLDLEIKKANRTRLPLALMFLDIDRFKGINDTLGHYMGDTLLIEAAQRLSSCVRRTDIVSRLGGDEFTIILTDLNTPGILERLAENIRQKMEKPFQFGSDIGYVSSSIGITFYPADADSSEALLKNADQAMYAAKKQGGNRYSYFTQSMQETAQVRMKLTNDLRSALADQQFRVYYQPIVELATGAIHKAEALIRWQHPMRGLVSPDDFIPIAEETGLIVDIGDWVFREAAKQVAVWRTSHHETFQISVNKSPVQFHNQNSTHAPWSEHLKMLGLPGQSIVVEITEGLLLDVGDFVAKQLLVFRDNGIQVSIDDFGTGFSALSYLQKFDIDYLKIDKSFVCKLTPSSKDIALCKAIIVMAHELGMKVIAEGVETEQQRDLLAAAGCDYGQGYLWSKPVPPKEFEKLLEISGVYGIEECQ